MFAVWLAAFHSSVSPAQHLAISLVRRLRYIVHVKEVRPLKFGSLSLLWSADSFSSCGLVWHIFNTRPGVWCDHLPHCTRRGSCIATGAFYGRMAVFLLASIL